MTSHAQLLNAFTQLKKNYFRKWKNYNEFTSLKLVEKDNWISKYLNSINGKFLGRLLPIIGAIVGRFVEHSYTVLFFYYLRVSVTK